MKTKLINISSFILVGIIIMLGSLSSCNKKLDLALPISFPQDSLTIGDYLGTDANYSSFKKIADRVGLTALLTDKARTYTVFAPSNDALLAIGLSSLAASFADTAVLGPIARYAIIPGLVLTPDLIPETFPNIQLPTALAPATIPGTILPFALTAFPSKRGTNLWYNNSPVTGQLSQYKNGVIYGVSKVAIPPSKVLAQILYADPRFTIFHAAINKGDIGQPLDQQVDSIIRITGANLTLFAPTNLAMRQLISQLPGGLAFSTSDAQAIFYIQNFVPSQTARGLVVYHLMGTRAFSVNFPTTYAFFPTFLNLGIPNHPGVQVQSSFTGQSVDSIAVIGFKNGGAAALSKPPTNFDILGINGIIHVIDRVLLPL